MVRQQSWSMQRTENPMMTVRSRPLPLKIRVWCNGSMPVSKTVDEGSNPSIRANIVGQLNWLEHLADTEEVMCSSHISTTNLGDQLSWFRAFVLHAKGRRFDSVISYKFNGAIVKLASRQTCTLLFRVRIPVAPQNVNNFKQKHFHMSKALIIFVL